MKLSICIAVMGQLEDTKPFWGCLIANTFNKHNIELLIIDNGSTDDTVSFLERFVFPHFPNHKLIHHDENTGVVASLQEAYTQSSGEVVALIHNDLFIFQQGWNEQVLRAFENPEVGLVGFFGAKGAAANGGRIGCYSNFLEAEVHGERSSDVHEVVLFDGVALIARRAMLDQVGGFDQNLNYLYYDKDISLESYTHGWKNLLLGVYCHHRSGVTANRPDYQSWLSRKLNAPLDEAGMIAYHQAEDYYLKKWEGRLPVNVG